MKNHTVFVTWLLALLSVSCVYQAENPVGYPAGFVSVSEIDPGIQLDIRYYTSNNFIGRPITGYYAPLCLLTSQAALALAVAQKQANSLGYSLKVYDCYRPQRAVSDFSNWARDTDDILVQHRFYPAIKKSDLFPLGYIAEKSGHSRGSTVDLTLIASGSQQPAIDPFSNRYDCRSSMARRYPDNSIDMGTGYDCFDDLAHTNNQAISTDAKKNRNQLRSIMESAGFVNYEKEWWHYTLNNEPFQNNYFDFPVNQADSTKEMPF